MKTSNLFSLNLHDFAKGLIVAVGTAVFALVAESVQNGHFTFDFTAIWHTAVAAVVAYLAKNFFTPAKSVTQA